MQRGARSATHRSRTHRSKRYLTLPLGLMSALAVPSAAARSSGVGPPSSWITEEAVYCDQANTNCSEISGSHSKALARAPSGYDSRRHCQWVDAGYSSSLGFDKHFCVALHGAVLGSAAFHFHGVGFGTQHPPTIARGPDQRGLIFSHIRWWHWGSKTAFGRGLKRIKKRDGGYYPQLVWIQLRADHVGTCSHAGPRAYRRLSFRVPSRPGGPLGPWLSWSICSFS